jgi:DNA-binding MarR family transcriptional regulator
MTSHELAPALRSAVTRLARRLRQEAALGDEMTPTRFTALATVEREGPLTHGELAQAEQVAPPTMTRVVSHLEELGYVERTADPSDRRFVLIAVTPAGRAFLEGFRVRRNAALGRRLAQLSPAERSTLEAAVPLLERLLQDER